MATGKSTYVDPSALLKLYLHEPESRAVARWRLRLRGPVEVTHHGRIEVVNAIALARFREFIDKQTAIAAWDAFEDDFKERRNVTANLLWRAALDRAVDLSREMTPKLGTRTLDVIHVASALELGFAKFLTFDKRQRQLAAAAGLKVVAVK